MALWAPSTFSESSKASAASSAASAAASSASPYNSPSAVYSPTISSKEFFDPSANFYTAATASSILPSTISLMASSLKALASLSVRKISYC